MCGEVHDSYTFQCGLVGSFTSPDIDIVTVIVYSRHQSRGPSAFSVSSERHWQGWVNGIAKVPKRSCPQWDSNPTRTVRSPVQANALTHSATLSYTIFCLLPGLGSITIVIVIDYNWSIIVIVIVIRFFR